MRERVVTGVGRLRRGGMQEGADEEQMGEKGLGAGKAWLLNVSEVCGFLRCSSAAQE